MSLNKLESIRSYLTDEQFKELVKIYQMELDIALPSNFGYKATDNTMVIVINNTYSFIKQLSRSLLSVTIKLRYGSKNSLEYKFTPFGNNIKTVNALHSYTVEYKMLQLLLPESVKEALDKIIDGIYGEDINYWSWASASATNDIAMEKFVLQSVMASKAALMEKHKVDGMTLINRPFISSSGRYNYIKSPYDILFDLPDGRKILLSFANSQGATIVLALSDGTKQNPIDDDYKHLVDASQNVVDFRKYITRLENQILASAINIAKSPIPMQEVLDRVKLLLDSNSKHKYTLETHGPFNDEKYPEIDGYFYLKHPSVIFDVDRQRKSHKTEVNLTISIPL